MSVREYVGARYVPLFADPLTWDATRTYESLTVVLYQGNSYTSRQAVPANIDITNTTYWAQTGNYNAQIEQYRAEVQTFDGRIEANADAISDEETVRQNADSALQTAIDNEATARQNADTALQNADTALQTAIDNEATARQNADSSLSTRITTNANAIAAINATKYMLVIGDSNNLVGDANILWHKKVARALGETVINKAVSGTGFIRGSNNFTAQLNESIGVSASDVEHVFIYGGGNDARLASISGADFQSSVNNTFALARQKYPNAEIVAVGITPFANYNGGDNTSQIVDGDRIDDFADRMSIWSTYGGADKFVDVRHCTFFGGQSFYYNEDKKHLTKHGYDSVANKILGGTTVVAPYTTADILPKIILSDNSTPNFTVLQLKVDGNMMKVYAVFNLTVTGRITLDFGGYPPCNGTVRVFGGSSGHNVLLYNNTKYVQQITSPNSGGITAGESCLFEYSIGIR